VLAGILDGMFVSIIPQEPFPANLLDDALTVLGISKDHKSKGAAQTARQSRRF
jgi:hypothetical protein